MSRSLILVRTTVGWEDVGVVRDHVRVLQETLQAVPGYEGSGAWRGVENVYDQLMVHAYESPEAMAQGIEAAAGLPALAERVGETTSPIDVMRVGVEDADGAFAHGVPSDALLSASVRVAEPGYGPEAVMEFEDEFGGLSMVDGYAGMVVGTRVGMADEVVGLTAWRTADGLAASVPESGTFAVTLYEPVGEA